MSRISRRSASTTLWRRCSSAERDSFVRARERSESFWPRVFGCLRQPFTRRGRQPRAAVPPPITTAARAGPFLALDARKGPSGQARGKQTFRRDLRPVWTVGEPLEVPPSRNKLSRDAMFSLPLNKRGSRLRDAPADSAAWPCAWPRSPAPARERRTSPRGRRRVRCAQVKLAWEGRTGRDGAFPEQAAAGSRAGPDWVSRGPQTESRHPAVVTPGLPRPPVSCRERPCPGLRGVNPVWRAAKRRSTPFGEDAGTRSVRERPRTCPDGRCDAFAERVPEDSSDVLRRSSR